MVLIIKKDCDKQQFDRLIDWVKGLGLGTHLSVGESSTILGLVGDTSLVDTDLIEALDIVESVKRISEPYKKANRKFHPADTEISVKGSVIGGKNFTLMAGPCSVESDEQITAIAMSVKRAGAAVLRGGAFKPRTSPYAFQGLKSDGLKMLIKAGRAAGLPIVSEIMNTAHLDLFSDVDIIQVGARNMQNFELLKELGHSDKPVLLKRGLSSTIEELLMSAEYIMSGGNSNVILCERGIRTFETYTRNTLDLGAVALLKELTHLPVLVDPSHATGISRLVEPLSLASAMAGADGLIIEVHNDPEKALCDGPQCIRPDAFSRLTEKLDAILPTVGKTRREA